MDTWKTTWIPKYTTIYDDFVFLVCRKDKDIDSQKVFLREMDWQLTNWIERTPFLGKIENVYDLNAPEFSYKQAQNAMLSAIIACCKIENTSCLSEKQIETCLGEQVPSSNISFHPMHFDSCNLPFGKLSVKRIWDLSIYREHNKKFILCVESDDEERKVSDVAFELYRVRLRRSENVNNVE